MKKSAYIGLGALLALMLGLAFGVNFLCTNNEEPIDVSGARTHNGEIATRGNPDSESPNSHTGAIANFDLPYRTGTPTAPLERLQINTSPNNNSVPPASTGSANIDGAPTPSNPQSKQHTVQQGDNYYKLAEKYYGSRASRFVQLIAKANPDKNPAKLKIGDVLVIPPKPADAQNTTTVSRTPGRDQSPDASSTVNDSETRETKTSTTVTTTTTVKTDLAAYKTYTVKEGEGFRKIARNLLGDENKWKELFELNRDLGIVKDENDLQAGEKIALAKLGQ
jgi:LysM repeat protein